MYMLCNSEQWNDCACVVIVAEQRFNLENGNQEGGWEMKLSFSLNHFDSGRDPRSKIAQKPFPGKLGSNMSESC